MITACHAFVTIVPNDLSCTEIKNSLMMTVYYYNHCNLHYVISCYHHSTIDMYQGYGWRTRGAGPEGLSLFTLGGGLTPPPQLFTLYQIFHWLKENKRMIPYT